MSDPATRAKSLKQTAGEYLQHLKLIISSPFKLDIYGETLMDESVRSGMRSNILAMLTTGGYIFVCMSLFWTGVLNLGEYEVSIFSPIIMGLAFASTILFLNVDGNLLREDTRKLSMEEGEDAKDFFKKNRVLLLRLAFILFGILPNHLGMMIPEMNDLIERHLATEATIEVGVNMIRQMEAAEARAEAAGDGSTGNLESESLEQAEQRLSEAREEQASAEAEFAQAEAAHTAAVSQESRAQRAYDGARGSRKSRHLPALEEAQRNLERTTEKLESARSTLDEAKAKVARYETRTTETMDARIDRRDDTSRELQQMQNFIAELAHSTPENPATSPSGQVVSLDHPGYGIKVVTAFEIIFGIPPAWPAASEETQQKAKEVFVGMPMFDKETHDNMHFSLGHLFWAAVMLFICMIFELLPVYMKLSASPTLKNYYNVESQALAGNEACINAMLLEYGEDWKVIVENKRAARNTPGLDLKDPVLRAAREGDEDAQQEFLNKFGHNYYQHYVTPYIARQDPLLEEARKGDEDAQRDFFRKYGDNLYNMLVVGHTLVDHVSLIRAWGSTPRA